MSTSTESQKFEFGPEGRLFSEFMDEFVAESDRAAVVLGAAKLDALLYAVIDRFLIPSPTGSDDLLDGDAPLATFSSRIRLCHRLGFIDGHFAKLLNVLRRLRNDFAHEVSHSNLSVGSARDRVLSLVEPFRKSGFFLGLVGLAAKKANRPVDDPGVLFRAVLALFYLELESIKGAITRQTPLSSNGIVETVNRLKKPKKGKSSEPRVRQRS